MKTQLRALLSADSGVSAIVGNRIDWGANAQGAPYPRVVLHGISRTPYHTMQGTVELKTRRVQIDAYALTAKQTQELADAIEAALDGYSGGGFQGIFLVNIRDGREGGAGDAERPFSAQLDFIVNHTQP